MMPSRTTPLFRGAHYLAFVPGALLGMVGPSAATIVPAGTSPTRSVVLSGDSVGSVRFGERQQKAVTALEKVIGQQDPVIVNNRNSSSYAIIIGLITTMTLLLAARDRLD